jgi:hypothetical protein
MGKIPSSDPDWLLEFPLLTSSAQFLENARMTVRPRPPFWLSPDMVFHGLQGFFMYKYSRSLYTPEKV